MSAPPLERASTASRQPSASAVADVAHAALEVIIDSKVRAPRARAINVRRPRLTNLLGSAADCPLVVISAPAGFGKTTLLTEWAGIDDRPFAWLALDADDNDPAQLVTSIAHAVGRVGSVDPALWSGLAAPGVSVLGSLVPHLVASIRSLDCPVVLVLTNLHEVTSPASRDVLELFADLVPAGVQIVVSSRRRVWLADARRLVHGGLLEIGPTDLAFDQIEIEQLLTVGGASPDPEMVEWLWRSTEGWPAGVHLATLARHPSPQDGRDGPPALPDRAVADYVRAEILEGLAPATRRFLADVAILDPMCGSLCDAVVGSVGSHQLLESAMQDNLFIIPLDDRGEWYRFHSVFRSVLLDDVERRGPAAVRELHARAAQWWKDAGSVDQLIKHARAAGDPAMAAPLMITQLPAAYNDGRLLTAQRWIREIGDEPIAEHPLLAALVGWIKALTGESIDAARWADHIATADGDDFLDSTRAALRSFLCAHGVEEMGADALRVIENEPVWGPWRAAAVGFLAVARWLQGDADAARLLFSESIDTAVALGAKDPLARYLSYRAILSMDRDEWSDAAVDIERARSVIHSAHLDEYGVQAIVRASAARLALHENDTELARTELLHAMRLRTLVTWSSPWAAVWLRLEMAGSHLALADPGAARTLLHEIEGIMYHRPKLGVLGERVDALRCVLAKWPTDVSTSVLTTAELRLLPYLQTHLSLKEIGDRLYISRNTVSTQVAAIYRKLRATCRSEAVDRARELGLLAPSAIA